MPRLGGVVSLGSATVWGQFRRNARNVQRGLSPIPIDYQEGVNCRARSAARLCLLIARRPGMYAGGSQVKRYTETLRQLGRPAGPGFV